MWYLRTGKRGKVRTLLVPFMPMYSLQLDKSILVSSAGVLVIVYR